jgi:hypothetical protein
MKFTLAQLLISLASASPLLTGLNVPNDTTSLSTGDPYGHHLLKSKSVEIDTALPNGGCAEKCCAEGKCKSYHVGHDKCRLFQGTAYMTLVLSEYVYG